MHLFLKLFHHNDVDLLWVSKIVSNVLESIFFCEYFFGAMTPIMAFFEKIESNYQKKQRFWTRFAILKKHVLVGHQILIGLYYFFLSYLLPFKVNTFWDVS